MLHTQLEESFPCKSIARIILLQKGEPLINPAGHSWENSSFYLMLCIALSLMGAGAYSAD